LHNIANAQTYQLQSIDGSNVQVEVAYRPSIKTLVIACAKDTIYLTDYWALDTAIVLNGSFLQVSYARRAGSNEGLAYTVLLCVDHNKLVQAMHIKSFSEYDMRNLNHIKGNINEYQLFKVKTQLLESDKASYKLNLLVHDESSSERTPKTNYNYDEEVTLNFDPKQNIFYTTHEYMSKSFTIYNPKSQKEIKRNVSGVVPMITIGENSYYYIKDEWYQKESTGYLLKCTYK
jgi:hypothetical protein